MSSGFEDTTILECNRLASEESKTNNNSTPSLYTNKLGSGIKVNAGDRISVYSAFISEKGAGGETIQFNGKNILNDVGETISYNLSYTEITFPRLSGPNGIQETSACNTIPQNNLTGELNELNQIQYDYPTRELAEQKSKTFQLKDNELNLKISYYKTLNGECSVSLPRMYLSKIPPTTRVPDPNEWNIEDHFENGLPHTGYSEVVGGTLVVYGRSPAGGSRLNYTRGYFVSTDYSWYESGERYGAPDGGDGLQYSFNKLKNDNSRYKIYIAPEIRRPGAKGDNGIEEKDWFPYREISEQVYIPYEEILTLKAPKGFSSPETIAGELTNQMRDSSGNIENFLFNPTNSSLNLAQYKERPMSLNNESATYKTFDSLSTALCNASTYFSFDTASIPDLPSTSRYYSDMYIQGFQYIGIKRPDFYEKGIELMKTFPHSTYGGTRGEDNKFCRLLVDINGSVVDTGYGDRFNASVVLDHLWTDENLLAWKNWFETQGNYPELFTNYNNQYHGYTSTRRSRFLHMNMNAEQQVFLGGDNTFTDNFSTGGAGQPIKDLPLPNASSLNSVPVYVDFQSSASNTYTNGGEGNPCYGFAYKRRINNIDYIGFAQQDWSVPEFPADGTYSLSGIPREYSYYADKNGSGETHGLIVGTFQASGTLETNPTVNNASGRLCGFDKHFNSYGMAVIGLTDGYLSTDFGNSTNYGINTFEDPYKTDLDAVIKGEPFAQRVYLGAQEPKFEYSASNNKFSISQLHSPEYIGNDYKAGMVSSSGTHTHISNPDAQIKVYKINKRILNNNFTTDMIPYSQNNVSKARLTATGTTDYSLSVKNKMIEPWSVFDAHSGIFIDDWGIPESNWDNSLAGILGFSYSQFNVSVSASYNFNTRLNENNKDNPPFTLTNADINVGDSINYTKNIWGAPILTPQVPLPMLFAGTLTTAESTYHHFLKDRYIPIYPAITESQNSIKIEASNLPTKMSRAYYTIRTNLLDSYTYLGSKDSGAPLKTISVVNKINGFGDYYFQQDNPLSFVITNPKTITEITTQICEPDGSLAQVQNDSCVMYKIDRTIQSSLNPVEELLQKTNKK